VNAYVFLKEKQKVWAHVQGISLIGSEIERGEQIFTAQLNDNLFLSNISDTIKNSFSDADGGELGNGKKPGKMQALHSSSAIALNVFGYWEVKQAYEKFAKTIKIPSQKITHIQFEEKFPILSTGTPPNIDVVFHYNDNSVVAIESKYSEPYSTREKTDHVQDSYLQRQELWEQLPNTFELAKTLVEKNTIFDHLHASQLIKHLLGLMNYCSGKTNKFRLIYVWYDAFGEEGANHRKEIDQIAEVFTSDGITFQDKTYQELIIGLAENFLDSDREYVEYIAGRYL